MKDSVFGEGARAMSTSGEVTEVAAERIVYSAASGNLALKPQTVEGWQTYNFEVEDFHIYVAGGIRVHNKSGPLGKLGDSLDAGLNRLGRLSDGVGDLISAGLHDVDRALKGISGGFSNLGRSLVAGVRGAFSSALGGVVGFVGNLAQRSIVGVFTLLLASLLIGLPVKASEVAEIREKLKERVEFIIERYYETGAKLSFLTDLEEGVGIPTNTQSYCIPIVDGLVDKGTEAYQRLIVPPGTLRDPVLDVRWNLENQLDTIFHFKSVATILGLPNIYILADDTQENCKQKGCKIRIAHASIYGAKLALSLPNFVLKNSSQLEDNTLEINQYNYIQVSAEHYFRALGVEIDSVRKGEDGGIGPIAYMFLSFYKDGYTYLAKINYDFTLLPLSSIHPGDERGEQLARSVGWHDPIAYVYGTLGVGGYTEKYSGAPILTKKEFETLRREEKDNCSRLLSGEYDEELQKFNVNGEFLRQYALEGK